MNGLYSQFKTDERKEVEGVIVNYGKNSKGENIDFVIARAGGANAKFASVAEKVMKPYRRQLNNESIDLTTVQNLMKKVYARSVVIGWSGVEDENNNPLEFNEANVIKVFTDLPDLFDDIRGLAEKQAMFRLQALEDESKN